jgi:cytochrome P450
MALTYILYQLTKHPSLIQELATELSPYKTVDDLNLTELEKLPLLNAVIHECMRIYPPVPLPTGRVCPPQGAAINGIFVPAGVHFNYQTRLIIRSISATVH